MDAREDRVVEPKRAPLSDDRAADRDARGQVGDAPCLRRQVRDDRAADADPRRERRPHAVGGDPRPGPGAPPVRRSRTPIVAWRGWRLVERSDGPALLSTTFRTAWDGPVLAADAEPGRGSHGIHAFRARAELERMARFRGDVVVFGQVTLFGRVAVHELGYRAERCRVDRLWLAPCGAHPVARCDCRVPAGTPVSLWPLLGECRREHDVRLAAGLVRGPAFPPHVRHAYCRCPLAAGDAPGVAPLPGVAEALFSRYGCDVSALPAGAAPATICTYLSPPRGAMPPFG